MSTITKSASVRLADAHAPFRIAAIAGEAIADGSPCYIADTGLAMMCVSTAVVIANVSAYDGVCISGAAIGNAVTLFGLGTKIFIADATLTIGTMWYVGAAGVFNSAAVASADTYLPIAKAITTSVIEIVRGGI